MRACCVWGVGWDGWLEGWVSRRGAEVSVGYRESKLFGQLSASVHDAWLEQEAVDSLLLASTS